MFDGLQGIPSRQKNRRNERDRFYRVIGLELTLEILTRSKQHLIAVEFARANISEHDQELTACTAQAVLDVEGGRKC